MDEFITAQVNSKMYRDAPDCCCWLIISAEIDTVATTDLSVATPGEDRQSFNISHNEQTKQ